MIAYLVFALLTVLALGVVAVGRRVSDRLRLALLAIFLVAPAAFNDGVHDWIADQMPVVPADTSTTTLPTAAARP